MATVVPWARSDGGRRRRAAPTPSRTARPGSSGDDSTLAIRPSSADHVGEGASGVGSHPHAANVAGARGCGHGALVTQAEGARRAPEPEPEGPDGAGVGAPRRRRPRVVGPGGRSPRRGDRARREAAAAPRRDILAEHFGADWRTSFGFTPATEDVAEDEPGEPDPYEVLEMAAYASLGRDRRRPPPPGAINHPDRLFGQSAEEKAEGEERIRVINAAYAGAARPPRHVALRVDEEHLVGSEVVLEGSDEPPHRVVLLIPDHHGAVDLLGEPGVASRPAPRRRAAWWRGLASRA